jgi:hypothetical protein
MQISEFELEILKQLLILEGEIFVRLRAWQKI